MRAIRQPLPVCRLDCPHDALVGTFLEKGRAGTEVVLARLLCQP
jgi:hypothetical protein